MKTKAILTIGISSSGKTTWATEFVSDKTNWIVISRDDIRRNIQIERGIFVGNSGVNWRMWKWSDEKLVTEKFWKKVNDSLNLNLIIADTNLNSIFRQRTVDKLIELGFEIEIKEFHISVEESWRRDAARENGVGHSVIMKQYEQWLTYLREFGKLEFEHVECDSNRPLAIISDIDGTIAHHENKRSPFDWNKVDLDTPNWKLRDLLRAMNITGYEIIYVSGRDEICRDLTEKWLRKHSFPKGNLFMRPQKDIRKDFMVKEEIFYRYINGNYNIGFVLDDRPQVIRNVWQKLGLTTLIAGNPWIEF